MPLVNLTLATFLKAEFGFLGVTVKTFKQTPLLNGEEDFFGRFFKTLKLKDKAGALVRFLALPLPFFINWWIVGHIILNNHLIYQIIQSLSIKLRVL